MWNLSLRMNLNERLSLYRRGKTATSDSKKILNIAGNFRQVFKLHISNYKTFYGIKRTSIGWVNPLDSQDKKPPGEFLLRVTDKFMQPKKCDLSKHYFLSVPSPALIHTENQTKPSLLFEFIFVLENPC